jgi:hypothetical protein
MEGLEHLPIPLGTHVGTGSGERLKLEDLEKTRQVVTGWELLEVCSPIKNERGFSIKGWLICVEGELAGGTMKIVERPTSENQFGKFRYDPVMVERERRYRQATGQQCISWEYDVGNGLDPLHGA